MLCLQGQYIHKKEVVAAQGVKIIAKDLDNSLAGLPLHVAYHPDEVPIYEARVRIYSYISILVCSTLSVTVFGEKVCTVWTK